MPETIEPIGFMSAMTRNDLIEHIRLAFSGVVLEDGIGLWEAFGLDGYAGARECARLRLQDEKQDWNKISVRDLYRCNSSLSFFDAKGMRFHLAQFLLLDLQAYDAEVEALYADENAPEGFCPNVTFTLTYRLQEEYSVNRFSLLNRAQITCVIDFLRFQLHEKERYFQEFGVLSQPSFDADYRKLQRAIETWKLKLGDKI